MNRRLSKKFLKEAYALPGFTLRQKVALRKTRSVFDCIRISNNWKPK